MFRKSVGNGIGYREQLLLDAIYVNETIDSVITSDEADSLRIKYNLLK